MTDKPFDLKSFADKISERAKQARRDGEIEAADGKAQLPDGGPLTLTKPLSQIIGEGTIVWRWQCVNDEITVLGMYMTKDDPEYDLKTGDYVVQSAFNVGGFDGPDNYHVFCDDSAREYGETLLSAYHWQFVWKQNAGDYLLEWLKGGEASAVEVPEDVGDECT